VTLKFLNFVLCYLMYKNVHCAVKVNIQCLASEPKASSSIPVAKIKKWQNEMRDNISVDVIEDLHVLIIFRVLMRLL